MNLNILEGKILVFQEDPLFFRKGWCILTGNIITEMQTMEWVSKIIRRKGYLGEKITIKDGKIKSL